VTLLLYREVWWGIDGKRRWLGWDCLESFWPDLSYYAGALRAGELPLWNPFDRGGYPFYGDPHPGLYYPVTWFFVGLGALTGEVGGWMIQAKALLHHMIAGGAIYAYLRSRRLPPVAAAFGGISLIVSTPMIIHKASALTWPMVWAPLIWIAIDRLVERRRRPGWWRRSALLAGTIALAGVAGPPPGFFYILVASLGYGVLRVTQALLDGHRQRRLGEDAILLGKALALAGVVTFMLLAVTVLPAWMTMESSSRAVRPLSYSLGGGLDGAPILRGFIAPTGGKVDSYVGLTMLVLCVAGLVARPRADRWAPVFFFSGAVLATLLSFGSGTPFLPFLVKNIPGFDLFREANRYKCLATMLVVVAGAHGLAGLLAAEARERKRALIAAAVAVGVLAIAVLVISRKFDLPRAQWGAGAGYTLSIGVLLALLVVLAAILLLPPRFRTAAAALLIPLGFLDVSRMASFFVRTLEDPVNDQEDRARLADLDGDVTQSWRVHDEFVMEQRPGSRLRIRDFRGYPSGDPFEDVRYQEILKRSTKNPELLEAYNVRWIFHGAHHRNGKQKNYVNAPPAKTAPKHWKALDAARFEALHPVPLVAWYGGVKLAKTPGEALNLVLASEGPDGARHQAVLLVEDIPAELDKEVRALAAVAAPPPSVTGTPLGYRANKIEADILAPAAGIVVLNEKMAPGWTVTVDDKPAIPVRASYILRGVLVAPGVHKISWTFTPPRYTALVGMWLAGLLFLVVAALTSSREEQVEEQDEGDDRDHPRGDEERRRAPPA
jgi:hypothetical protein